jgi:hypothetical protein
LGQFGAVPAAYVQMIYDESNSTLQAAFSDATNDNNSQIQTSFEGNYQPRLEEEEQQQQQYMNSTPVEQSNVNYIYSFEFLLYIFTLISAMD